MLLDEPVISTVTTTSNGEQPTGTLQHVRLWPQARADFSEPRPPEPSVTGSLRQFREVMHTKCCARCLGPNMYVYGLAVVVLSSINPKRHVACEEHAGGASRSEARPQPCCLLREPDPALHPRSPLPTQAECS